MTTKPQSEELPPEDMTDDELKAGIEFHERQAMRLKREGAKIWRLRLRIGNGETIDRKMLAELHERRASRVPASAAPVVDNERCYCRCHFQVTIRQDSCAHCDKCVMCGHAMQVDASGFCVETVPFGHGGNETDFVRCGCQCASATQYIAAAATAAPVEQSDELVDEVQRRMDQVVEAAVEWHQAGREGAEWFEAAEKLGAAIDSLLELRDAPQLTESESQLIIGAIPLQALPEERQRAKCVNCAESILRTENGWEHEYPYRPECLNAIPD